MDKDPNQSWFELIIPKGILEYFAIVGFDKGDSGKYVYDKTQDQVPILSLNIIFAKYPSLPSLYQVSRFKTVC